MPAEWNEGSCCVGVDLSAPKMLAGAVTPAGKLLGKVKFSAKPDRGPKVLLERVARCIRDAADECDLTLQHVRAVGVAIPGVVDTRAGLVRAAPLLGLEMEPFQRELEQQVQKPVVLENECNAAAWAVYTPGPSNPARSPGGALLGAAGSSGCDYPGPICDRAGQGYSDGVSRVANQSVGAGDSELAQAIAQSHESRRR